MLPPPPPPPPPPLLPSGSNNAPPPPKPPLSKQGPAIGGGGDRNALLSQIRQGAQLKKATTNDRSSPPINGKVPNQPTKVGGRDKSPSSAGQKSFTGGPPGLGDLFAQGVPKLRPTNKSFLDGGSYRSQLNPRGCVQSGPNTNFNKIRDNVSSKFASQNFSNQKEESSGNKTTLIKDSRANSASINYSVSEQLPKSNKDEYRGPVPPPPLPSADKKPVFVTTNDKKPNVVRSYLHNVNPPAEDSTPNSASNSERASPATRPFPLPKTKLVTSACNSPVKQNIHSKPRSYEDTDIPQSFNNRKNSGVNSLEFPQGLKSLQNSSIPSNLNNLQNGATAPRIGIPRPNKRPPVKPPMAPPPLPMRALGQMGGGSLNDVRLVQNTRDLSSVPSNLTQSSTLPRPPPPPPPRMISQTATMDRRRPAPKVSKMIPPQREKNVPIQQSVVSGNQVFESRFASLYRSSSEFPRPEAFSNKPKTYPSKLARQRGPSRRKARQPPPTAPPPPPPVPIR